MRARLLAFVLALCPPALAEEPGLPKKLLFDYQVAATGYTACGVAQLQKFGAGSDVAPAIVLQRALDDCLSIRRGLLALLQKELPDTALIAVMMKPADAAFRRGVLKGVADERALRDKTRR